MSQKVKRCTFVDYYREGICLTGRFDPNFPETCLGLLFEITGDGSPAAPRMPESDGEAAALFLTPLVGPGAARSRMRSVQSLVDRMHDMRRRVWRSALIGLLHAAEFERRVVRDEEAAAEAEAAAERGRGGGRGRRGAPGAARGPGVAGAAGRARPSGPPHRRLHSNNMAISAMPHARAQVPKPTPMYRTEGRGRGKRNFRMQNSPVDQGGSFTLLSIFCRCGE